MPRVCGLVVNRGVGQEKSVSGDGGYWVISVDRQSGVATTSELILDRNEAWDLSVELQKPGVFTTVVARRSAGRT